MRALCRHLHCTDVNEGDQWSNEHTNVTLIFYICIFYFQLVDFPQFTCAPLTPPPPLLLLPLGIESSSAFGSRLNLVYFCSTDSVSLSLTHKHTPTYNATSQLIKYTLGQQPASAWTHGECKSQIGHQTQINSVPATHSSNQN